MGIDIGKLLASLEAPAENAVVELSAVFGKTEAGQHILDIVNQLVQLGQRVQALEAANNSAPTTPASEEDVPTG